VPRLIVTFGLPCAFGVPQKELAWSVVYRPARIGQLKLLTRDLAASQRHRVFPIRESPT